MTFGLSEMSRYLFSRRGKNSSLIPFKEYRDIPRILCEGMTEYLLKGGKIRLERIGVIEVKLIAGRECHNPKTGERFRVGIRKGIKIKPSKYISDLLNNPNKKKKRRKKIVPRTKDKVLLL